MRGCADRSAAILAATTAITGLVLILASALIPARSESSAFAGIITLTGILFTAAGIGLFLIWAIARLAEYLEKPESKIGDQER